MIMLDRAGGAQSQGGYSANAVPLPSEPMMHEQSIDINDPYGNQSPQEEEIKIENIPF